MTKARKLVISLCSCIALVLAYESFAKRANTGLMPDDLELLATNSNLIIIGTVTDISYGLSESETGTAVSLPFALVTYDIHETLRGAISSSTFTMAFIGGPNGSGQYLTVSGVPHFQVQEQDLLFVSGNGEIGCPLVLCESGRYRISEGKVFNSQGMPVRLFEGNRAIAYGEPRPEFLTHNLPPPSFETLMRDPLFRQFVDDSGHTVDEIRTFHEEHLSTDVSVTLVLETDDQHDEMWDKRAEVSSLRRERDATTSAISVDTMMGKLRTILATVERRPEPLQSINVTTSPPTYVSPHASEPPSSEVDHDDRPSSALSPSPEDVEESRLLQKQGFNPVIRD